jgi:hypothetical protein
VRYIELIKAKPIHKGQTHPLRQRMIYKDCDRKVQLQEKSGREPQGSWRRDEMIGGKPSFVK